MKRPEQHLIDSAGQRLLREVLEPLGWVVRDIQEQDYGIDFDVEVFKASHTVRDDRRHIQSAVEKLKIVRLLRYWRFRIGTDCRLEFALSRAPIKRSNDRDARRHCNLAVVLARATIGSAARKGARRTWTPSDAALDSVRIVGGGRLTLTVRGRLRPVE
jgi:hypothetical protein